MLRYLDGPPDGEPQIIIVPEIERQLPLLLPAGAQERPGFLRLFIVLAAREAVQEVFLG